MSAATDYEQLVLETRRTAKIVFGSIFGALTVLSVVEFLYNLAIQNPFGFAWCMGVIFSPLVGISAYYFWMWYRTKPREHYWDSEIGEPMLSSRHSNPDTRSSRPPNNVRIL
jgi:hypothetical protein